MRVLFASLCLCLLSAPVPADASSGFEIKIAPPAYKFPQTVDVLPPPGVTPPSGSSCYGPALDCSEFATKGIVRFPQSTEIQQILMVAEIKVNSFGPISPEISFYMECGAKYSWITLCLPLINPIDPTDRGYQCDNVQDNIGSCSGEVKLQMEIQNLPQDVGGYFDDASKVEVSIN